MAVGVCTLIQFDYGTAEKLQFSVDETWISVINSNYTIGLDGISLPLYFLSMAVTFLVAIYTWDNMPDAGNPKAFLMLMLVLQVGMAGSFIAQDLILFFVFFELVLLPMYFMIGVWGGEDRQYASLKFFLYTMFGSALMLVAFLALFFQAGGESFGFEYLMTETGAVHRPGRADLDLRRHVHRLRRQGADVPVPHLAARRSHAGAHPGLGHPGRHPPEARHLRLRADRAADAARREPRRGRRSSASSP